jgi:hypothetical protein
MQHPVRSLGVERVQRARRASVAASSLDWETRVLLAAAEAADSCVAPQIRAAVACAIADKAASELRDAHTVRAARLAVVQAISAGALAPVVPAGAITRLTWRMVFDLWGGPNRDLPSRDG